MTLKTSNILPLLAFTLFFLGNAQAQKIKIKNKVAYVDGESYLNWERVVSANAISVWGFDIDGEEIYMTYLDYVDRNRITSGNPQGLVRWVEINFITLKKKCEVPTGTHKSLAKLLYRNNIYVDGKLNEENVDKLIQKFGMRFSESKPSGTTIIINN